MGMGESMGIAYRALSDSERVKKLAYKYYEAKTHF